MYSQKQLQEVVELVEKHEANPYPIDATTTIKTFGQHFRIGSDVQGVEGDIVVSRHSVLKLGQILSAIGLAIAKAEAEAAKNVSQG